MKQIKAHIAVSLDGFIATSDNELDWITSNVKSLIGKEYEAATCLLMGANTYTYLFEHWGESADDNALHNKYGNGKAHQNKTNCDSGN